MRPRLPRNGSRAIMVGIVGRAGRHEFPPGSGGGDAEVV
jgi:hypothetical protein